MVLYETKLVCVCVLLANNSSKSIRTDINIPSHQRNNIWSVESYTYMARVRAYAYWSAQALERSCTALEPA